ncbi:NADH:flavin oxidoreductase/NADH oxidase [Colletotrichum gloeosporioides Cg-14]|uniref:NADH:flavin oxidoreductase/NADH oxidase n=1 Tax=Colletotrichum gloeosporioides (strain Cg-14) TaxID=1237896 RepID=T0M9I2_COLGC|nr:NADH:flavin oxidoreductase/NADH oxidase [Colletotrichum gloeosporioides Cg-14]
MSAYHTHRITQSQPGVKAEEKRFNEAADNCSFFSPKQEPRPGSAVDPQPSGEPIPKLFTPLKIRGATLQNRIWVSPMCQYSAHEGFHTPWHIAHYGGMVQRGPGLMMVEATAVQANGRITPEDSGIWLDAHVETLKKHVEFAHSQNQLIAIQLAHAGRKASTLAPWLGFETLAGQEAGGWPQDVAGPSDLAWSDKHATPREMTLAEIDQLKQDFVKGAYRSLHAGFDVIELHFAHGYLISSFLSPASNKRTDQYGGSFENRTRLAIELVDAVREVIPKDMPLFVRISATDWLDTNPEWNGPSWTVDESVKLAQILADHGVDVLDVSTGGNHSQQKIVASAGFQAPMAKKIKAAVGDKMLVSAVGIIRDGNLAEKLITGSNEEGDTPLDLIAAGRGFQKNPGLVWQWADDLGVDIHVAKQIGWGFTGRVKKVPKKPEMLAYED